MRKGITILVIFFLCSAFVFAETLTYKYTTGDEEGIVKIRIEQSADEYIFA